MIHKQPYEMENILLLAGFELLNLCICTLLPLLTIHWCLGGSVLLSSLTAVFMGGIAEYVIHPEQRPGAHFPLIFLIVI